MGAGTGMGMGTGTTTTRNSLRYGPFTAPRGLGDGIRPTWSETWAYGPWTLAVSEYIVNDRDLTLTVKAETAHRDACGITPGPPARAA